MVAINELTADMKNPTVGEYSTVCAARLHDVACGSPSAEYFSCDGVQAMSEQTLAGLSERLARNEERMNTHQATQESAFDRLRADMAKWDAEMAKRDAEMAKRDADRDAEMVKRDAEMAKRDAARDIDMAKRDKDNTRWLIGMWVAAVIVLGTFLSTLITWPP